MRGFPKGRTAAPASPDPPLERPFTNNLTVVVTGPGWLVGGEGRGLMIASNLPELPHAEGSYALLESAFEETASRPLWSLDLTGGEF